MQINTAQINMAIQHQPTSELSPYTYSSQNIAK